MALVRRTINRAGNFILVLHHHFIASIGMVKLIVDFSWTVF